MNLCIDTERLIVKVLDESYAQKVLAFYLMKVYQENI